MKIQNTNTSNASGVRNTSGVSSGGSARAAGGSPQQGDEVQLSGLSSASRAVAADSAEHASRIGEISKTVSAGRYQVDPQQLSSRLIDAHLSIAA
jgi:flagellar biosynthesis anti-sigma factor FlgM